MLLQFIFKRLFLLKDNIDHIIKNIAKGGPKRCILNAFGKSPPKLAQIDLVKKQDGHGTPVACLIGQLYPGSQGNLCLKNKYEVNDIGKR